MSLETCRDRLAHVEKQRKEHALRISELEAEVARLTAEVDTQKRQISFLLSERKECKECGRGFDNGSVCGECLSERK